MANDEPAAAAGSHHRCHLPGEPPALPSGETRIVMGVREVDVTLVEDDSRSLFEH